MTDKSQYFQSGLSALSGSYIYRGICVGFIKPLLDTILIHQLCNFSFYYFYSTTVSVARFVSCTQIVGLPVCFRALYGLQHLVFGLAIHMSINKPLV